VMQATGNTPPATVPARGVHLLLDLKRTTAFYGIDAIRMPSRFPISSLLAQRVLTVIATCPPTSKSTDNNDNVNRCLMEVSRRMWQLYWAEDQDISQPDVLVQALVGDGHFSLDEATHIVHHLATEEATKAALKATTEEAIKRGAYGAPTIFVRAITEQPDQAQMFFGSDRFHLVAHQLGIQWQWRSARL